MMMGRTLRGSANLPILRSFVVIIKFCLFVVFLTWKVFAEGTRREEGGRRNAWKNLQLFYFIYLFMTNLECE